MGDPGILGVRLGLDRGGATVAQIREAVGNPVNMVFDPDHHVDEHRRAARAGDDEHVGEPGRHQAQIVARASRPFVLDRASADAADVDPGERAGERVIAGRTHDDVDGVVARTGADTRRRHRLDRLRPEIDEVDIVAVVEIVRRDADALGTERMVLRAQRLGYAGVADQLADAVAHEGGSRLVGREVRVDVVEGVDEIDATLLPAPRIFALPFVRVDLERTAAAELIERADLPRPGAVLGIVGFPLPLVRILHRPVAGRDDEVRRALEDEQLGRLPGNDRDRLDARRARADHRNRLSLEVDRRLRPVTGMVGLPLEVRQPRDIRQAEGRERAAGHDAEAGA